jgi:hypothetical protein
MVGDMVGDFVGGRVGRAEPESKPTKMAHNSNFNCIYKEQKHKSKI